MRNGLIAFLIAVVVSAGFLCVSQVWAAEETQAKKENVRRQYFSGGFRRNQIAGILDRIRETDPARAQELEKLQQDDPAKFEAELKQFMEARRNGRKGRQTARHRMGQAEEMRAGQGRGYGRKDKPGYGAGHRGKPITKEKYEAHLKWLEKNYPEEAKQLEELRQKSPRLFSRRVAISMKRYWRIRESEKENPRLTEVMKQDLELTDERNELIGRIKTTEDEAVKEKLKAELVDVVSKRFDLILERRQIHYEQLLERLKKLQQDVEQSKARLERWKKEDFKQRNVTEHIEELLQGKEEFEWK